jgi:hypothetical protein
MLSRIIYSSRCQCDGDEVARILRQSREANAFQHVTGALYLADGMFLQYLEGGDEAVDALYRRIAQDRRHTNCRLIDRRSISGRVFKDWSMAWLGPLSDAATILRTILAQTDSDACIDSAAAGAFFYAMSFAGTQVATSQPLIERQEMKTTPKVGDTVTWETPQGETTGKITRKVTKTAQVKGHVAKASPEAPQYEVESDKTGKKAIHKAEALK